MDFFDNLLINVKLFIINDDFLFDFFYDNGFVLSFC